MTLIFHALHNHWTTEIRNILECDDKLLSDWTDNYNISSLANNSISPSLTLTAAQTVKNDQVTIVFYVQTQN